MDTANRLYYDVKRIYNLTMEEEKNEVLFDCLSGCIDDKKIILLSLKQEDCYSISLSSRCLSYASG